MNPAFSVIFLTTLIGAGQGLFLALFATEVALGSQSASTVDGVTFYVVGSAIVLLLTGLGLLASFFHLGHPERAWRAAAMWRTSWLSREVIVLPAFMSCVALYGASHYFAWGYSTAIGAAGVVLCFGLFVCTAMIYAAIKFLQEWHSPLTIINYTLLGCASGMVLVTAFSAFTATSLTGHFGNAAIALTLVALATRTAALVRNARLKPKSSLQSAIGVQHPHIVQKAQGFMGGSFNTREFFHGQSRRFLRAVKWGFLLFVFALPLPLLLLGIREQSVGMLSAAFFVQFAGLIAERWFFFAQANHPQNLYYQTIS